MEQLSVRISKGDNDEINIYVFLETNFLLHHTTIHNPTRLPLETWRRFVDDEDSTLLLNLTGNQYAKINHSGKNVVFHSEAYPTNDYENVDKRVTSDFTFPFDLFKKEMSRFLNENEEMFEEEKESFGLFN